MEKEREKQDSLLSRVFDKFVDGNLNVILSTSQPPVAHEENSDDLRKEEGGGVMAKRL